MTICAAVMCQYDGQSALLFISDRMLTSGDIEFEADQSKVFDLYPAKAVCLGSGPADVHFIVSRNTWQTVVEDEIVEVDKLANLYAKNLASFARLKGERVYLTPLGLDTDTFVSRQREMDRSLVRSISKSMQQIELGVNSLVAGVDSTGPHIYSIGDVGEVEGDFREIHQEVCRDVAGFCAVGMGARQFETLFMVSSYSPKWEWQEALQLMYSAKKKAEVSPGVGTFTDVYVMLKEGLGFFPQFAMAHLDEQYKKFEEEVNCARGRAFQAIIDEKRIMPKMRTVR